MLATEGWRCSREQVAWAVQAMIGNSERSTPALAWLLSEMSELPDQSEADARLVDLTLAIAAVAQAELPASLARTTRLASDYASTTTFAAPQPHDTVSRN